MHLTHTKREIATQRKEHEQMGGGTWWVVTKTSRGGEGRNKKKWRNCFLGVSLNDPNDVVLLARYEQMGRALLKITAKKKSVFPEISNFFWAMAAVIFWHFFRPLEIIWELFKSIYRIIDENFRRF